MEHKNWLRLSVGLEVAGSLLVAVGIGAEVMTREPAGLIAITTGSLIVAVGSGLLVKCRKFFK